MPVGQLSGGEQARVLLATLMLQPADLLVLDEPTNDLDIPTLEVLEESLLEFPGAVVLVTHDRFLFERVTTTVLALDGRGGATAYADAAQWEEARRERLAPPPRASTRGRAETVTGEAPELGRTARVGGDGDRHPGGRGSASPPARPPPTTRPSRPAPTSSPRVGRACTTRRGKWIGCTRDGRSWKRSGGSRADGCTSPIGGPRSGAAAQLSGDDYRPSGKRPRGSAALQSVIVESGW